MSKPLNKSQTYLRMGMLASAILFVAITAVGIIVFKFAKQQIVIPVVAQPTDPNTGAPIKNGDVIIGEGKVIKQTDIDFRPVNRYGLPEDIITDPNILVGKYVLRDYRGGEFFWSSSVVQDYPKLLSQKIRYSAMAIPVSLIGTSNAEIMPDDFIKIDVVISKKKEEDYSKYNIQETSSQLPDSGISIIAAKELGAVRVVGFYDGSGHDITKDKLNSLMDTNNTTQSIAPGFLIVDVTPMQEALLIQGMYGGSLQVMILSDEVQRKHKLEWGLIDEQGNKIAYKTESNNTGSLESKQADLEDSIRQAAELEQQRREEGSLPDQPSLGEIRGSENQSNSTPTGNDIAASSAGDYNSSNDNQASNVGQSDEGSSSVQFEDGPGTVTLPPSPVQ